MATVQTYMPPVYDDSKFPFAPKKGGIFNDPQLNPAPAAATAAADRATAVNYAPESFHVTPDQTVNDQIAKIVSEDSKLMQQARTRANQEVQARGLLNSSLAVEAGQNAVIGQAMPIAQSDAAAYERAATNTVNANNAAAYQNAQAANTVNLENAKAGTTVNLANASEANKLLGTKMTLDSDLLKTRLTLDNQMALAKLDASTKTELAKMDNEYRGLLQLSQNATNKFNQVMQSIAQISQNNTMYKPAKDAAIATQLNMLKEALKIEEEIQKSGNAAVKGLNLGQFFNFTLETARNLPPTTTPIAAPATNQPVNPTIQQVNQVVRNQGGTVPAPAAAYRPWK
jgi:hypothetical protein